MYLKKSSLCGGKKSEFVEWSVIVLLLDQPSTLQDLSETLVLWFSLTVNVLKVRLHIMVVFIQPLPFTPCLLTVNWSHVAKLLLFWSSTNLVWWLSYIDVIMHVMLFLTWAFFSGEIVGAFHDWAETVTLTFPLYVLQVKFLREKNSLSVKTLMLMFSWSVDLWNSGQWWPLSSFMHSYQCGWSCTIFKVIKKVIKPPPPPPRTPFQFECELWSCVSTWFLGPFFLSFFS